MENKPTELTLHLRCCNLPRIHLSGKAGVRLGVQKGKEVVADVAAEGEEIHFLVPVLVRENAQTGTVDYSGSYVHGRPGERFVYICWGHRHEQAWEMSQRAKLPLSALDKRLVQSALRAGKPLQAVLDMTNPRGEPVCATIREDGVQWQV